MSIYHRYQPIYGAEQHLYCEGCPVYVHRYQISADLQSGGRILQVRMVNMSEWEVNTVFLRIACLDGAGNALSTMYAVPLTNLSAGRGQLFGETCTLRLSTSAAQMVQIFPERVIFSNGMSWNETETAAYVSLPAPLPVLRTDVDFDRLDQQAQKHGVHNDYRYQELENAWYCSCGLPNAPRRQFCGYCGTNREWLRLNMNGRAAVVKTEPAPLPEPEPQPAPEPQPEQQLVPESQPEQPSCGLSDDASVAELLEYMNQKLDRYAPLPTLQPEPYDAAPEEEFPMIQPLPRKKSSAGKVIGIILLVLAIAAAAGFCVIRFLMPQLRYNQANDLEIAGSYEEARQIFTELGSYADAQERVSGTWYQQALALMREGNYDEAYQTFCKVPDFENSNGYAADCLYSLGVIAFNDGDTDLAWNYVQQLQTEYPDYAGATDLYQSCCYARGNDAMTAENYDEAKSWFMQAGDYKNSAELVDYCDYMAACSARDAGDYALAVEAFRTCTYGDSADQVQNCMMLYVENNGSRDDELTMQYLTELCDYAYPGAAELYEQMYGWTVTIHVTDKTAADAEPTDCTAIDAADKLNVYYAIQGGQPDETMGIVILYTLPNGTTGNVFLISDAADGDTAYVAWSTLQIPAVTEQGTLKIKFCNADSGNELYACEIEIKPAE